MPKLCRALFIAAVVVSAPVRAAPILDQSADGPAGFPELVFSSQQLAQTFTVGLTGQLTRVDVKIRKEENPPLSPGPISPLLLDIRPTASGAPQEADSPVLASASIAPATIPTVLGFVSIDLSPIAVNAGDVLAIALLVSPGETGSFRWAGTSTDAYGGGRFFARNAAPPADVFAPFGSDLVFRTFVDTATVPEPATLTIFGIGLTGLGLLRRRRRSA